MNTNRALRRFSVHTCSALLLAAALGAVIDSTALAADVSEEPTSMPDYCSNREVNCVLPDTGQPVLRAVSPVGVTPPSSTPTVPSAQGAFTAQGTSGNFSSSVATPAAAQSGTTGGGAGFAAAGRGRAR